MEFHLPNFKSPQMSLINPPKGDVREALPGAGGGPWGPPPIFLCSGATKRSKIMFPHNFGSFPTDLSLFQNFFSTNHKKNAKIENILLKNEQNFEISQFLTYINIWYIKRKHFSCRNQFHTEKVWFFARKIEKNDFFDFFIKIEADQLSLIGNFWKL